MSSHDMIIIINFHEEIKSPAIIHLIEHIPLVITTYMIQNNYCIITRLDYQPYIYHNLIT